MGSYRFAKFYPLCLSIILFSLCPEHINSQNLEERAALLVFFSGVKSDPNGVLRSWVSPHLPVCNFTGITCDKKRSHVVQLDVSNNSLQGTISSALGNLSFLQVLDLSNNFFHGSIPAEIGSLLNLNQLSLSSNYLEGRIPLELGHLNQLQYLNLGSNRLVGEIPRSLFCNSTSLQYLDLSNNSLSGEIPLENQCALPDLRFLLLWSNKLVGQVPTGLRNSRKLEWLDLESNALTGELPSEIIKNMPFLQFLYLSYNEIVSHDENTNLDPFFSALANASNLQELELAGNNLGGELTSVIGNLSKKLRQVHLDDNHISGSIPSEITDLVNLTLLNLSCNLLNGSIPPTFGKLAKLERLYLSNNSLSGAIPPTFGNIPHLGLLDLSFNNLSGSIPDSFANLPQLRSLLLNGNRLSGPIPPSLGRCVNMQVLDLSYNQISGTIPSEVAGLRSLNLYLNLSNNHLSGSIPFELSKMEMVLAIDFSMNNLSGGIPSQLGSCIALEYLNLSFNHLDRNLPNTIGQLPFLQAIDVSNNQLAGEIPASFQLPSTLKHLNFSFNQFSGYVLNKGTFSSLTYDSFMGNHNLCGSIKDMPRCHRKKSYHFVILLLAILFAACGAPVICFFWVRHMSSFRGEEEVLEKGQKEDEKYPRISHQRLVEATDGFSSSRLIGSGRFGQVYKGSLLDNNKNMRIAVKVLDPKMAKLVPGSFSRECRILKRTRHRNLMRIITICSKANFKAIVFPLMSNGSLERHLYPSNGNGNGSGLDLFKVISICSDVAEGVAYLHHHSPVKVVHCDLKPSNILLDDDMNGLVTDFGISRLVEGIEDGFSVYDSASGSSTDGLLCGSFGYIAPEYGLGKRASTEGDVYSFGVLLLEIVTGKRPTQVMSHEGSTLHDWVKRQYPSKLEPIIESALARFTPKTLISLHNDEEARRELILELIDLGLMCTQYSPSARPSMLEIANEMGRLKQYLSSPPTKEASSKF